MVYLVLNLIITGIPSIRYSQNFIDDMKKGFKPYYNWNTFNTYTHIMSLSIFFKRF